MRPTMQGGCATRVRCLLWSPDSSRIATFRHDGRNVGEMYLWSTQVGHGELDAWKYPLPGDDYIFMIERIVDSLWKMSRALSLFTYCHLTPIDRLPAIT